MRNEPYATFPNSLSYVLRNDYIPSVIYHAEVNDIEKLRKAYSEFFKEWYRKEKYGYE